jgi:hypothetical protein
VLQGQARGAVPAFSPCRFRRHCPTGSDAYGRDLAAFLDFLAVRLASTPDIADLEALLPTDFRAWLVSKSNHKASSRARGLGAVRSFFRFLNRREQNQDFDDDGHVIPDREDHEAALRMFGREPRTTEEAAECYWWAQANKLVRLYQPQNR